MATTIRCPQCGYDNDPGASECEICAEPLGARLAEELSVTAAAPEAIPQPVTRAPEIPAPQTAEAPEHNGREYYVFCPESQTKTVVRDAGVTRFFCEGCRIEHDIDGFLWQIEVNESAPAAPAAAAPQAEAPKSDDLWLEEINTGHRIDIARTGGTLGRYGTFGGDFFLSHNMHTVSGEHCRITYEYGAWVLRHISRTNSTHYNGVSLGREEPTLLEDGRLLVLANTVTLRVHIG